MANTKHTKIRSNRRKFRYPYRTDFDENIEDERLRRYPVELASSYSADSQGSDMEQQLENEIDILDQCSSGLQEHFLSDHASIDVLILEREMKTVLTDMEKFGILEDDYKSLATTTEEEEKVDDSVKTWPPFAFHSQDSKMDDSRNHDDNTVERENDWEVLSSTDSVWTVETFAEERSFRDALIHNSPYCTTTGCSAHFYGEPRIHTVPVEMMPPIIYKAQLQPKQVVNLEMLERADLWTSIRDSIRGFGARNNPGS
ncbi:hypothetical protein IV203_005735 [Nitzschia inconspicua]|uniref:Uncharacterized protein n=1 Tax=Nitzschia inconspicua TaxID=303405 RepID=A0A9K3KNL8_9STRA|nr:hypothetical protein IV203_005735 [Nitzschia inconspicua]